MYIKVVDEWRWLSEWEVEMADNFDINSGECNFESRN